MTTRKHKQVFASSGLFDAESIGKMMSFMMRSGFVMQMWLCKTQTVTIFTVVQALLSWSCLGRFIRCLSWCFNVRHGRHRIFFPLLFLLGVLEEMEEMEKKIERRLIQLASQNPLWTCFRMVEVMSFMGRWSGMRHFQMIC